MKFSQTNVKCVIKVDSGGIAEYWAILQDTFGSHSLKWNLVKDDLL